MKLLIILFAMILNFGGFPADRRTAADGKPIIFHMFGHASIAVEYDSKTIYADPWSEQADYSKLPKADVILVTHDHYDHFDPKAIEAVSTPATVVICNPAVAEKIKGATVMRNGQELQVTPWLKVEAVEAYNAVRSQYHPKGRDNGYVLTVGGSRIYIAGDSEATPELKAVEGIDFLFLPVNLPYTMNVEDAVEAVKAIAPTVFYPYHTIGTPKGEIESLKKLLPDTETHIVPME